MKKIIKALVVVLLAMSMISPTAFAKNDQAKESLVALGDSIPFGYNLGQTNNNPSKAAYPYLIGADQNWRVRNLAVSGMQSHQLLHALRHDQKYRQAVRHSDYVMVSIGSNDLLQILREAYIETNGTQPDLEISIEKRISNSNIFVNITKVLKEIRSLTDARIVIYNFYNPFYFYLEDLSPLANPLLFNLNKKLSMKTSLVSNVNVADAFGTFSIDPGKYLIPGDVHPSAEGQQVLSEIGIAAFGLESKSQPKSKVKAK